MSRDYHAQRAAAHLPGDLVPVAHTNHFTVIDALRRPDSGLMHTVLGLAVN